MPSPGRMQQFLVGGQIDLQCELQSETQVTAISGSQSINAADDCIRKHRSAMRAATSGRYRRDRASSRCLRNGSTSNVISSPFGRTTTWRSRSTVRRALAPRRASAISWSQISRGRRTGKMPFLKQLLWKMSAKSGAMTQRMPKSSSAQGACSRDEPQPKFSCAIRICARRDTVPGSARNPAARRRPASKRSGVEQMHAEAGALDGLQEARRNDLVGIDIGQRQRRGDAGQAW